MHFSVLIERKKNMNEFRKKLTYEKPEVEVIELVLENSIATSGGPFDPNNQG
jgi:hypothetical protein